MFDQLAVEEANERLNSWDVVILHVVALVDRLQKRDASWLLILFADVFQQPIELQGLDRDRCKTVVKLFLFIILLVIFTAALDQEALKHVRAEVGGVARRVLNDAFVVQVIPVPLLTRADRGWAEIEQRVL